MFLILQDYIGLIQLENLNQIIRNNQGIRPKMELTAQSEISSYLAQRYDVALIFRDTLPFSYSTTYKADQLVYLDADPFDATLVYSSGELVLYEGFVYWKNAITTDYVAGVLPTNENYFTQIGKQYDFFYVSYPSSPYEPKTIYAVGDKVFWRNKEYTCLREVKGVSPDSSYYWGTGVSYEVSGVLPTVTEKWTAGDNRNQQIVTYMIDITLYHLHSAIAPRNIPDHRKIRYDGDDRNQAGGAIGWLKRAARGEVSADLPLILPDQGNRIRFGGHRKNINHY